MDFQFTIADYISLLFDRYDAFRRSRIETGRGVTIAADSAEKFRQLQDHVDKQRFYRIHGMVEPGDYMGGGYGAGRIDISLSAPIAYDVYYLWPVGEVLPEDKAQSETEIRTGFLSYFFQELLNGAIVPLRAIRNRSDLIGYETTGEVGSAYANEAPYHIKGMRYEFMQCQSQFQYPSAGEGPGPHVGYLAFPIGHLGVMHTMSLISEVMLERGDYGALEWGIDPAWDPGTNFFPPPNPPGDDVSGEVCIRKGYLIQTGDLELEYPADEFVPLPSLMPHYWLRRYIGPEEKFPVPGEFLSTLAWPMPYHLWWFQEQSPFAYAGDWYDTQYYSSGIVTEVYPPNGDPGETYQVAIYGKVVTIVASDFYEYEVGDRVTVLKTSNIGPNEDTFLWSDRPRDPSDEWMIVPFGFWET